LVMTELNVTTLGKHFGYRWIFRNISFHSTGGIVGIAGTNGSGKSTLLRCLAGLYKQDVGSVKWNFDGQPADRSRLRTESGYAAPYIRLYREMSAMENLKFLAGARLQTKSYAGFATVNDLIAEHLDRAGILAKADTPFKALSSGQQQRLKLISAILHRPRILFLDEPGTNLDERGHAYVRSIIAGRNNPDELTLLASNDPRELELCQVVVTIPDSD
jgi:ABC-type multidrug transport system ATPase subunit